MGSSYGAPTYALPADVARTGPDGFLRRAQAPGALGARIRKTVSQAIPTGASTLVEMSATTALFDAGGFVGPAAHGLTVPAGGGGVYDIAAAITYDNTPVGGGDGVRALLVMRNGVLLADVPTDGKLGIFGVVAFVFPQLLVPGDVITMRAFQGSGVALNVVGTANATDVYTTLGMVRQGQ